MEYAGRSMQKEAAAGVKQEKASALQLLCRRPGSHWLRKWLYHHI